MVCLCSTSNQHVGVNLKAHAIIMMDAFCYCTPSELLSVCARRQKLLIDGIKPSWSLVFIECYQVCLGVLSQRHAIGFPMLLSLGMWIVTGWIPTETGCVSPTRDTVQSEWGRCRNHSLCWSQEVALTSGFRGWLGGGGETGLTAEINQYLITQPSCKYIELVTLLQQCILSLWSLVHPIKTYSDSAS